MTSGSDNIQDSSRQVLADHAKSFNFASKFLGQRVADRAAVLYAFCRLVDDIADEGVDASVARTELQLLVQEMRGNHQARPLVQATRELLGYEGIYFEAAMDLVDGVVGDLGSVRIQDERALIRYAYSVAGTVGTMMCRVMDIRDERANPFAVDLGIGMQLTNICRDVSEDLARDRVYIPEGWTVDQVLFLAERYYLSARDGYVFIPWRARFGAMVAANIYRAIGAKVGFEVRAFVPNWQKLVITVLTVFEFASTLFRKRNVSKTAFRNL